MRATGIRYQAEKNEKTGKPPEKHILEQLCDAVLAATSKAGFNTEAHVLTGSAIKIGLHMSSFRVNTAMLGHNARIGRHVDSPKGYKRTDVPTWDQRVQFNDIVNDVFDQYGLVALIKSGCFTVRDKKRGRWEEEGWEDQTPTWMGYHGAGKNGYGEEVCNIYPESEARELMDSDAREAEHKAARNLARRQQRGLHLVVAS